MTSAIRMKTFFYEDRVLVIKAPKNEMERVKDHFVGFGLRFRSEKHGDGPEHYAAQVGDYVLEIYPND